MRTLNRALSAALFFAVFLSGSLTALAQKPESPLAVTYGAEGTLRSLVWQRPGREAMPLAVRRDTFAGFSFHLETSPGKEEKLPNLSRKNAEETLFSATRDGIVYSLQYISTSDGLEVIASIQNGSKVPFAPQRVFLHTGIDTEMVKYPEWNERFFPTLLRCEKTHFWGYLMRPDGVILGIASPDPIVSWSHAYKGTGHRIRTSSLDLMTRYPQPARHPQANIPLAPGESRRWRIFLVPMETQDLAQIQPTLARVAGIPMITLDCPTVEEGHEIRGTLCIPDAGAKDFSISDPEGTAVSCIQRGDSFSFIPAHPGIYTLILKSADGKVAEATASCRMPWSWYTRNARANAVSKPQKGGGECESFLGLMSGYVARIHFPDKALDDAIDAKFKEIAPLIYDLKTFKPLTTGQAGALLGRIQNHTYWISVLVTRYRADGDVKNLEFAASLADYIISQQGKDGAYRHGNKVHYTCVGYMAKSIMELMDAETSLAQKDPKWKARLDLQAESVRRAMDDLALHLENIGTEGEMTYEDGMIACEYTQLALYALRQTDSAARGKYLEAARKIASGHRCLSQIVIPDSRMNGGSLRYWESQYDILTGPNMMTSPHGWSAWRLYGLWYLYQLTGEKEYLRQAMNGLGSCVQLIDFKTGDLRWAFVTDPCVHATVFQQDPTRPGWGIWKKQIVGEQYMPMISGWFHAKPNTWTTGYWGTNEKVQDGGCCDNDVHEIFKCLEEIALDSAYIFENRDGSFDTWNCRVSRNEQGVLLIIPAEAAVSRIHFNLKHDAPVHVSFASAVKAGEVKAGMTWFKQGE